MAASETDAATQIRLQQTDGKLLRAIEDALARIRHEEFGICALAPLHPSYRPPYGANGHPEDRRTFRLALPASQQFLQPCARLPTQRCRSPALSPPGPELGLAVGLRPCAASHTCHFADRKLFRHAPKPTPEIGGLSRQNVLAGYGR